MRSNVETVELINRSGIVVNLISTKGRECSSCHLPRNSAGKLMEVPGLAGQYCSVLCAEQAIYEKGCAWCGGKSESGMYCREECHRKAKATPFGDGERLRDWLRRHGALPVEIPAARESCLHCGGEMEGKRSDASFCSNRCKMAYWRSSGKLENGQIAVTTSQQNQQLSM